MMNIRTFFDPFNKHLLGDEVPSLYFQSLIKEGLFPKEFPFAQLKQLTVTEQNPIFHPEGNVWEHTMQVVDAAARYRHLSANPQIFMWTSLLHDIGKSTTTRIRGGRITAYDHDIEGCKITLKFLAALSDDQPFIQGTSKLVRWHMQPLFVFKKLPYARLAEMLEQVSPSEIGLFSLCDRLGRNNTTEENLTEAVEFVKNFLNTCQLLTDNVEEKSRIIKILYDLTPENNLSPIH